MEGFQSLFRRWPTMEEVSPSDFILAIVFAIGIAVARFLLDVVIYRPLARMGGTAEVETEDSRRYKITQRSESMWNFTYHGAMLQWDHSPDVKSCEGDIEECFEGWPHHRMIFSLKVFYMCHCGYYLYSSIALLTRETQSRRKDWKGFPMTMSHHIIATALIWFSFVTRFFRIGAVILEWHDVNAAIMEMAFLCTHSEEMAALFILASASSFMPPLMALVIITCSRLHSVESLWMLEPFPAALYYVFNTMLLTLLVFHAYWWKLVCARFMRRSSEDEEPVGQRVLAPAA